MLIRVFVLCLLNFCVQGKTNEDVRVKTKFGELRGFLSKPFSEEGEKAEIYLNIPFALPPIGKLRFEKPQLYNLTWDESRDASKFGPCCVPALNEHNLPVSEDCLTLNIFKPHKKKSTKPLPVLVYVHGGGYAFGSALIYGYQQLANNYVSQDLILITIQYRLGFFGFASTGDANMQGNLGLWDQTVAFQWIYENIGDFGGDSKRITAQGLSAGAASVGLLSLSPHSRGYISGTIEMSGAAVSAWSVSDESIDYTRKFAQHIDCPSENSAEFKDCLRTKSTEFLLKSTTEFTKPTWKFLQFTPVIDGDFFPKPLDQLLIESPKIPNLIGVTALETNYFIILNKDMPINSVAVPPSKYALYNRENLVDYVKNFTHSLSPVFENKKLLAQHEILKFYCRGELEIDERKDKFFYLQRFNELTSDFFFVLPAMRLAQSRSAAGYPTYFYLNSYFNTDQFSADTPCQAATHANEYPYMNGLLFPVGEFKFNENDRKFQKTLNKVIGDFAKNGKPSPTWPQVKWNAFPYGELTKKLEIHNDFLFKHAFEFWESLNEHLQKDVIQGLPKLREQRIEL